MRRAIALFALLALFVVGQSGCKAAFRNYRTDPVEAWPPAAQAPGWPLSLRVYGAARLDTARADLPAEILRLWQDMATSVYQESGLFARLAEPWEQGVWVAEISFAVREESRVLSESFVIYSEPFRRSELLMRTRFRDPEGRSIGVVEASESIRTYVGLLGIPLSLGNPPARVRREAIRDLFRSTLDQAVAKGILTGVGGDGSAASLR